MTSEIDKLKHFHVENYSGTNFTDDLNDGEEFLYTTIRCKDDKEVTLLCKYVKNKHIGNCLDCVFNKYLCYGLLCNIVVLKVIKDEESKRYIKKQNNKPLINKKVLAKVIRESNICKHAIKELKLAGYGNGEGGPNDWMYQQVIEAVAVFASHGNSGSSAHWEINLVQRLCDWDIISPLKFTDDEWSQISSDGTCQNRRKSDVFKEPNGSIHYNGAFSKRATDRYSFDTKEWTKNKNPICWHGGLFEHKNNVLTGRYFNTCLLYEYYIDKGWMPKETIYIDCVEVEISPDNWIMAVDADNTNLLILSCNYSIQWEECSCLKGIRLEDVTAELEEEAYEEMRHN